MKKIYLAFVLGTIFLTGCGPKHEIIPAPEPKVELDASFNGSINGTPTEIAQSINSYNLEATKTKIILPSPQLSSAVYYAELKSSATLTSIRIAMGSVAFDAGNGVNDPSTTIFRSFFTSNLTPPYSTAAATGFEVVYRDNAGVVWTSKTADPPQSVVFSDILQEADGTGEYNKFKCTFACNLYYTPTTGPNAGIEQVLPISNAVFIGWFKL